MRPKIILLSISISALFVTRAAAQDKPLDLSLKLYGGYGLFNPGTETYVDATSNITGAFNKYKYGLGSGPHAGAGVSLKLNDVISVGLDADFLTGTKTFPANTDGDTVIASIRSKYSVFSLIPNVSFNLYANPRYSVFNRMGIITAVITKVEFDHNTASGASDNIQFTGTEIDKYSYGLNLGFQDAFGIRFNITKNIKIFGELSGYYLPVNPHSETTANTITTGGNTTYVNEKLTFLGGNNTNYTGTDQIKGNTFTDNESYTPTPQHIVSIGITAGLIIDLKN